MGMLELVKLGGGGAFSFSFLSCLFLLCSNMLNPAYSL